ncbi:RNA 2',3'-cyclic phosphodiesterase [Micromonospora fluostatini]|uniref:RNA 2',3'-cyclic phosphodiesterase n=1 Tax=Micromonospora sp. JCM 30529 TaxID=3421643 RepID=UPI003D180740
MRLFVGVFPPPGAVEHLVAEVARLRVGVAAAAGTNVRLADPTRAHLTLAFLGDVGSERLPGVEHALGLAAERTRGGAQGPPVLRLGGGGRFGWGRTTVLWVDVRGDLPRLVTLAGTVRTGLAAIGVPADDKPFRPHLTIARPADRMPHADVEADRAALDSYLGPPWPAAELVLVQSRPGVEPGYRRLATWPL